MIAVWIQAAYTRAVYGNDTATEPGDDCSEDRQNAQPEDDCNNNPHFASSKDVKLNYHPGRYQLPLFCDILRCFHPYEKLRYFNAIDLSINKPLDAEPQLGSAADLFWRSTMNRLVGLLDLVMVTDLGSQ